ncbi:class I SAM-dependent methyltransferase [Nocardioides nanhaiensis]|uniref:Class I SAM-dependent methyltransferase n=1 Tax=Nocardioides nanhaiensis TaxID=1476871 RepID=A0ABP8W0T7_9ACTN
MPDLAVLSVDEQGITLHAGGDEVLDVLLDGRRIWSFWSVRDTEPSQGDPERRRVDWPQQLARYLDGTTCLTVRSHVNGVDLFDEERRFGTGTERIAVVDRRGVELAMDKSGRMQVTFEGRTERDVEPLLDSVEVVIEALADAGVEAFPAYGTLLGAVRDGALIGHDSDADLGYVSRHTHPADVILESFAVQRHLAAMGYEVVRYSGGGIKVTVEEGDGGKRGLDVFSGYFDGEGRLVLLGEVRTPFEESWIRPLGTTTLEGRTLPAPAEPAHLLEAMYGPGWRTPDPAFRFETPASTTTRLNDWFRGTSVGRADWDRAYQRLRHRAAPRTPSPLARMALRREDSPALVVDAGCGRGTDARFLARRGVPALGLDYSTRAFELVAQEPETTGLPLEFGAMNLLELRHALAWGARVGATPGHRVVVARHLVDALPRAGRENLWRFLELACHDGGRAYLDFLVSPASEDPWARRSLLRPVGAAEVRAGIEARGGKVLSQTRIRSDRMGVRTGRRDTFRAHRRACRMVVEW